MHRLRQPYKTHAITNSFGGFFRSAKSLRRLKCSRKVTVGQKSEVVAEEREFLKTAQTIARFETLLRCIFIQIKARRQLSLLFGAK